MIIISKDIFKIDALFSDKSCKLGAFIDWLEIKTLCPAHVVDAVGDVMWENVRNRYLYMIALLYVMICLLVVGEEEKEKPVRE